ncbi:nerve growth factor receptor b [Engraulis encrasicolus]|uniref:nerve growth factor receptor b n=1 Tax=Engraulis encrasicolus TaxID=184585 RepID=UPI002FD2FEA8
MFSLIFIVLFGASVLQLQATQEACRSGKYTKAGECCRQCQPGEGVVQECGATQTVCTPCLDSETFSENWSHTERCTPCTRCVGKMRMETPCTDTNDATCVCDYGYYADQLGVCQPCTVCPVGSGVLMRCDPLQDTVCELCLEDGFSDHDSALDPCMPCDVCEENEIAVQQCTSNTNAICVDPNAPNTTVFSVSPSTPVTPTTSSPFPDSTPESATTAPRVPSSILDEKLIPIYCSIFAVAAVVASLVAFIVFKRWNSCKKNKQGAGMRTGTANPSQTPSPEGEKLHSDSGISVDSQSLQEQLQQGSHTVVKIDGVPCLALPLHARQEVEKLLSQGCGGGGGGVGGEEHDETEADDWCSLAGLLGYEKERIATFQKEERPIQALLTDWESQGSANMDTLFTALRKINREDIVQSLATKPTATSAV